MNPLFLTDTPKITHPNLYPPGTTHVYSYFEAHTKHWQCPKIVFFGLQYLLQKYFQTITKENVDEATVFFKNHYGKEVFNRSLWDYIVEKHHGHLPISIKSVPEGSVVPVGNILFSVENTDPACFWLPNYLEHLFSLIWYPCSAATVSREMKMVILNHLDHTGDSLTSDMKLFDLGMQDASSVETAGIGGCAHLINFQGSFNTMGLLFAQKYYYESELAYGFPYDDQNLTSTWCEEHEVDYFQTLLAQYPEGLIVITGDTYDFIKVLRDYWGIKNKEIVLNRKGVVAIRNDIEKSPDFAIAILEHLKSFYPLLKNEKGFWVLPPNIRIWQNNMDLEKIEKLLELSTKRQFSADNYLFGAGSGILQDMQRQHLHFQYNTSHLLVNGCERYVYKKPKFDNFRASKGGKLKLTHNGSEFITKTQNEEGCDHLQEVFRDGKIIYTTNLQEIRLRAFVD